MSLINIWLLVNSQKSHLIITGHQNVSVGYKERGGHCKELRMMQGRGNRVSMEIFILSKTEISTINIIHSAVFNFIFAVDILACEILIY